MQSEVVGLKLILCSEQNEKRFWRRMTILCLVLCLTGTCYFIYQRFNPNYLVVKVEEIKKLNNAVRFLYEKVKTFEDKSIVTKEDISKNEIPEPQVLIVTAKKARIREAPSEEGRTFMHIAEGSRLVAINKQESWYQIYTPHGLLAWISEGVVALAS